MSLDTRPEAHAPLRAPEELLAPFRAAFKPPAAHRLGLEHENVGYLGQGPVPYAGPRGIEELLLRYGRFGLEPFLEHQHPIAMLGPGMQLSLEPGGQVELAGSPSASVRVIAEEQTRHFARLRAVGSELGLVFTSVGYRPVGTPQSAEWVPKERYGVMSAYLRARAALGLDMMTMTGTAQVSVDFADEAELADKVSASASVSALVTALCANSPLRDGKPSGYLSFRMRVWQEVDDARCGLQPFLLQGFTLQRYVDWALDAPMIFIRRGGAYRAMNGLTFRRYLAEGAGGERATAVDWADHLTTLFPDVRVKQVLELRTADAAGADLAAALAALWKGVLYDRTAREEARALTAKLGAEGHQRLRQDVARQALGAPFGSGTARDAARDLLAIARRGLGRQGCADEAAYLAPMEEIAESGITRAERLLQAWERGGLQAVIAQTRV